MAIGLITMFLWLVRHIDLVVFTKTTMVFNTALLFVFAGLGVILLQAKFFNISKILGGMLTICAVLILSQDLFQIDLKVDQFFVDFYYPLPHVIPGRISIQASTNFIFTGICIVLLSLQPASRLKLLTALLLALLVFIIAALASFGYFFKLAASYDWKAVNPIAINTVITFLFLSMALILYIIQTSLKYQISITDYVHYFVFFGVFSGSILLWQALVSEEMINAKKSTYGYGMALLHNFEANLKSAVESRDPVIFRMNGLPSHLFMDSWKKYSKYLLKNTEYVKYIGLFTKDFDVVDSAFLEPISIDKAFLKKSLTSHEISLSSPLTLNHNKKILLALYPVKSEIFKGYLVRAIDADSLVRNMTIGKGEISFILKENNTEIAEIESAKAVENVYSSEFTTHLYGKDWKLTVWPTQSFIKKNRSILPEFTLGIGILFAFLLAASFRISFISFRRAKALKKAQANLLVTQQIAYLGGWVWDLKQNMIHFTEQALKILGLNINQVVLPADRFFYLVHPNEADELKNAISAMRSGRSGYSEVYTFVRPDEEVRQIRFAAEVSAFQDHYPIEISGILQDVTKLKLMEEELHQFQKMELIGQFTGGIAHDFNNILMVIQGNLELLSLTLDKTSKEYKKVETALVACARGSALTKRLLAFARRESLHPEVIDLKAYMNNFKYLLKPALGDAIDVFFEVDKDIGEIQVDPNQLESALLNLVINARDAMDHKGSLKIKVENVTPDQIPDLKKAKISYEAYVKISIIDSGSGMTPDVLARVFEPFFTTKPPTKGTGLGLSMVKGFVEQSNGHIRLSSKKGEGTIIELYFASLSQEKVTKEEERFSLENEYIKGHEIVLIAEDEKEVRTTTAEYLRSLGYVVIEADNGDIAFNLLQKNKNVDLLFTDVVMPGTLSGPDLAALALNLRPHLKVLFCSGYPEKAKGNAYNLSPLIIKPYKLIELAITLRTILKPAESL